MPLSTSCYSWNFSNFEMISGETRAASCEKLLSGMVWC